jgi:hypothetical protein
VLPLTGVSSDTRWHESGDLLAFMAPGLGRRASDRHRQPESRFQARMEESVGAPLSNEVLRTRSWVPVWNGGMARMAENPSSGLVQARAFCQRTRRKLWSWRDLNP